MASDTPGFTGERIDVESPEVTDLRARVATLETALREIRDGLQADICEFDDVMGMIRLANEVLERQKDEDGGH